MFMKKKYKALILDVDGTIVPNKKDGMPSENVAKAITKASKKIHVGIATSRPLFLLTHILKHLKLSGPTIINGGAQIIDFPSQKIIYEQTINKKNALEICKILKEMKVKFFIQDNGKDTPFSNSYISNKPFNIVVYGVKKSITIDNINKKISNIPSIVSHMVASWTPGEFCLVIGPASATKQHAILQIAKILKIKTHEIIGVGDGYNDFPLLMACGLKVAMGNAVKDLKEIADYIAPSVDEDGVADVIEKFVL